MMKNKTYKNGILIGTLITSVVYSIILFLIINDLTH